MTRKTIIRGLCVIALLPFGCAVEVEDTDEQIIPLEEVAPGEEFPVDQDELGLETTEKGCAYRSDYYTTRTLFPGYWGGWQSCPEFCPEGSFAYQLQLRRETYQGSGDDTAANGVRLHCYNKSNGLYRGYVDSHAGYWGGWSSSVNCSTYHVANPVVGGRILVEDMQGGGDDTVVNSNSILCKNGQTAYPTTHVAWGEWLGPFSCPAGTAVCGIRTKVEGKQGWGDDTALNGVQFNCCVF